MTATPSSIQYRFANWTEDGNVVSTSPSYSFTLLTNCQLVAHLIPNPFLPLAGTYHGLIFETNAVVPQCSGCFTLTATPQGRCSGSLQVGGVRYSLSGQFDLAGHLIAFIPPRDPTLEVDLQLDLSSGTDRVSGTVSSAAWIARLAGDRAVFSARTLPATNCAGKYTMVVPGVYDSTNEPCGDGWATLTVDNSGWVRLRASMADGTKLAQAVPLSKDGVWPLYASVYNRQGLVLGWIGFANAPTNDLSGGVVWIKPTSPTSAYYPKGFGIATAATGSRYSRPPSGTPVLSFSAAELVLSGGGLTQGLTNYVTLHTNNLVTSANQTSLTFTLSSGAFRGRAPNPDNPKAHPISFSGVVLQKQNCGRGWFLGTNQCGGVYLDQ